mgnify:CR=1 FL=1
MGRRWRALAKLDALTFLTDASRSAQATGAAAPVVSTEPARAPGKAAAAPIASAVGPVLARPTRVAASVIPTGPVLTAGHTHALALDAEEPVLTEAAGAATFIVAAGAARAVG